MKTKNPNTKEAQARGRIIIKGKVKETRVSQARTVIGQVKANPEYATTPSVQACTAAFETATSAMDANVGSIKAVRTALIPLLASQVLLDAAMRRAEKTLEAVITDVENGSAEGIQQWGLSVAGRTPTPVTYDPPEGLRVTYDKSFQLTVRWNGVPSHIGYEIEMGDGSTTGWGQPIPTTMARFIPTGLIPGQRVAFRVAVRRPCGLSAFSDVLVVTAH